MKKTRKNGQTTRERILEAAKIAFLRSGYSGTSIDDIAGLAEVNRSLIFHHYENKQELWKVVKESIAQEVTEAAPELNTTNLRAFVEQLITFKFKVYETHPDLARMIAWQKVEETPGELKGTKGLPSFESLANAILELQRAKKIRDDLEPKLILTFMFSALSGVYSDEQHYFNEKPERKKQYVRLVIDAICEGLAPREKL